MTVAVGGAAYKLFCGASTKVTRACPLQSALTARPKLLGFPLCGLSLKTLWLSVVLEAVVLGVVQVVSVATKSIDLGGSTTER